MAKKFFKIFFSALTILYPVLIFLLLVVYKFPVRVISLCVIALALIFFISSTGNSSKENFADARENSQKNSADENGKNSAEERKKNPRKFFGKIRFNFKNLLSSFFFLTAGILCFVANSSLFLKLYPVAVCATFLFFFATSLVSPPPIVFRFATMQDKSILKSPYKTRVENYCKKVTIIWCAFFVLNIAAAIYTAFFCSEKIWSIYNGGISYLIMGMIFAIEFFVRMKVNKKMQNYFSICDFKAESRADDFVMCFEGVWSDGVYKTWKDFLRDTAKMRAFIQSKNCGEWILHCNDYWYFLVTFVALLQCKKQVMLTANISSEFIKEMKQPGQEFLSDAASAIDSLGAFSIASIIENSALPPESEIRSAPKIVSEETRIHMFTSGSTGKPKDVVQRMKEFEQDNAFIFSKWGDEFLQRKLLATVSQHHIYGFLFTISLPFAAGVPFRRTRIEFPSEFEKFSDEKYMIIAVPAFLKRTNDAQGENPLPLKEPFIFTSGGVLLPEVAKRTNEIFGFWPVEVYGSTETSGIAWRQSKNGLEWTPFDNAEIWQNDSYCLVIKSPYIKNPEGFETADLVEILPDGKFILKGRADSIVKIEEKRVSLAEVENRILQSGFVQDVCVVAMSDRRQYLAAAVAFNEAGKQKFCEQKKFDVNMFFHDYLMQFFENVVIPKKWRFVEKLPCDLQGKHKKQEIQALFAKAE
ncbi:MAG: AMP-binding protein [Treponemataceae bacterium]|nr:AMP-binding protein [Treponemataceae bacterium]